MATAQKHASAPVAEDKPAVLGGVVPYLSVRDASAAADFYVRAFGAREVFRYPPDEQGRTMHIHLYVNGGSLMLSDPFPEHGCGLKEPQGYSLIMRSTMSTQLRACRRCRRDRDDAGTEKCLG